MVSLMISNFLAISVLEIVISTTELSSPDFVAVQPEITAQS